MCKAALIRCTSADAQMEGGCLPLPAQGVAISLTPAALALLSPGELHVSLVGSPADYLKTGEHPPIALKLVCCLDCIWAIYILLCTVPLCLFCTVPLYRYFRTPELRQEHPHNLGFTGRSRCCVWLGSDFYLQEIARRARIGSVSSLYFTGHTSVCSVSS